MQQTLDSHTKTFIKYCPANILVLAILIKALNDGADFKLSESYNFLCSKIKK